MAKIYDGRKEMRERKEYLYTKRYHSYDDSTEMGEYLSSYTPNLNNAEISIVAIWTLNGSRNAWGNYVNEGGGHFLNNGSALKHFNKYRRSGSSWNLIMHAGFLIKETNDTFLVCSFYDVEYNKYIKDFIGKKKVNEMLMEVLDNKSLRYYKVVNYNNSLFLDDKNIGNIGVKRDLN